MTTKLKLLSFVLAALPFAAPADAQTMLTPTTLTAAVTASNQKTLSVASATNCIPNNLIYTDRESSVIESVSGLTLTVRRGAAGNTASTHSSGILAICGPPGAFAPPTTFARVDSNGNPVGTCVRTAQLYLPIINVKAGVISDCLNGSFQSGDSNNGLVTSARFRVMTSDSGGTAYTSLNGSGTAVGATTLYCTEVMLPNNKLLTGIGMLNGTTVTANLRYVILYDNGGNAIANSALAGQASVTASVYENYPFTAKYLAVGPGQYFACLQDNAVGSTTVRMVVTGTQDNLLTKGQTGATFGTIPVLVPPTTFTTAVGPYMYLY